MADWKILYNKRFTLGPMTPWVHRRVGGDEGDGGVYDPPLPLPLDGKGYATFRIVVDRFPFIFASLHELDEAIRVLDELALPAAATGVTRSKKLPVYRKLDPYGASSRHWTERLPKQMLGAARRRKIVWELKHSRDAIKKALGPANVARAYGRESSAPGAETAERDSRRDS
jgi:hypothetical protein